MLNCRCGGELAQSSRRGPARNAMARPGEVGPRSTCPRVSSAGQQHPEPHPCARPPPSARSAHALARGGPGPCPAAHARAPRPHAWAEAGDAQESGAQCGWQALCRDSSRQLLWRRQRPVVVSGLPGGRARPDAGGDARLRPSCSPPPSRQGFALWAPDVAAARANGRGRLGGSSRQPPRPSAS